MTTTPEKAANLQHLQAKIHPAVRVIFNYTHTFFMQKTIALICLFAIPCFLMAQVDQDSLWLGRKDRHHIQTLKKGVLVVRLPAHQNKINALKKIIDNPKVSEKDKTKVREQLATTITEGRRDNRITQAAFRTNYRFSEVYFMYDTAVSQLKKGILTGHFLNDSLEIDPAITLKGRDWFTLRIGYLDATQQSGAEAMIITDNAFNDLTSPFPAVARLDNLSYLINKALAPDIAMQKRLWKAVKKLNDRLGEFYADRE